MHFFHFLDPSSTINYSHIDRHCKKGTLEKHENFTVVYIFTIANHSGRRTPLNTSRSIPERLTRIQGITQTNLSNNKTEHL